jgi:hypothetical protein
VYTGILDVASNFCQALVHGELTGLPLFRRRIGGFSKHTEMAYEVGAYTRSR